MHIHVMKGGGYAKIDLATLDVSSNYFKAADINKALAIIKANRNEFMREWNEFFTQRQNSTF